MLSLHRLIPVLAASWVAAAGATPPPLSAEQFTVEKLEPRTPHWAYVVDEAFTNEIDSRVFLIDGDSHRRLGQIGAGFYPGVTLSPDAALTAVATTYFSRGTRGQRTDLVELTDNATLDVTGEIVLPSKRALTLPTIFNLGFSSDSRLLYVSYITPGASFGVLDPIHKKVLGEIDTAGCVLVIPWGPDRISSICESGRLLTVRVNERGGEVGRELSDPFFSADTDPIFVQGVPTPEGYEFLSFLGRVHRVDLRGTKALAAPAWSIVNGREIGKWRPGGVQMAALHRNLARLYVLMHEGAEGSHKDGATEIWVMDERQHSRLARWRMPAAQYGKLLAVQVSQDDHPLLFAATEQSHVLIFDALSGHLQHVEKQVGQTPWVILTPDLGPPQRGAHELR